MLFFMVIKMVQIYLLSTYIQIIIYGNLLYVIMLFLLFSILINARVHDKFSYYLV